MDSPLGLTQPWTPPETDAEPSPRTDYFSDPYSKPHDSHSPVTEYRWSCSRDKAATMGLRCDSPAEDHHARPKPVSIATAPAPYTPTKTHSIADGHAHAHGAPCYPYTPDSSRILRRNTELPSSPIPWDDYREHSPSPVQHALSSCIAHFENLLQTRQPDEDQMEYIVGQFEAMASYLSAPEAQSRKTDEHLFSDQNLGLGIMTGHDAHKTDPGQVNEEYAAEVEAYITNVKKYIEDLKMRLDEVKMLNSIQLDVIQDLRSQMKTVRQGMPSSLSLRDDYNNAEDHYTGSKTIDTDDEHDSEHRAQDSHQEFGTESWETLVNDDPPSSYKDMPTPNDSQRKPSAIRFSNDTLFNAPRRRVITILRTPERRSFWASIGHALDSVGDLFLEQ